jgi:hypothetical protein
MRFALAERFFIHAISIAVKQFDISIEQKIIGRSRSQPRYSRVIWLTRLFQACRTPYFGVVTKTPLIFR